MESLIRQLERQAGTPDTNPRLSAETALVSCTPQDQEQLQTDDTKNEHNLGRLLIQDSRSCYVSNIFWANLGDQIEELRDLLHEPAYNDDDEDDYPNDQILMNQSVTMGSNASIMGFRSLSHSLRAYHPSLSQAVALFGVFQQNVVPVVHIFHMPTLDHIFWDTLASLDQLDKDKEALMFAIYYSTVISIDSDQCLRIMGLSRPQALRNLLFATQQALARANLLSTQSMAVLQAAVLFLSALRNEDDSSTVWSLTSLVYHLARAMGLHRDGSSFGLMPLEVELRRRLWWHVCLLDVRSSEYQGCEPIVQGSSFDTKLPLNINDRDLTAEVMDPPKEREEATEMTFCLIRCESIRVVWKISYNPTNSSVPGQIPELSYQERLKLVEDLQQRLDERYVQRCDTTQPLLLAAATVARLITARTWLVVHYPLTRQPHQNIIPSKTLWQRLFEKSVEILQLSLQLSTNKDIAKWAWHSRTHVQWHAIALVLSMICSQPPSSACDQAWECVTAIYDRWNIKEDDKKGALWRPIKRLMAKARYIRDMQELTRSKTTHHGRSGHDALIRPVDLLQTGTVEPSSVFQSSSMKMPPVSTGNEPFSGTHLNNMDQQSTNWLTDQSINTIINRQDTMGLGSLWNSNEANAFPQGMPYTTTGCEIDLENLDLDLMELGWI
ncbi:hypothetical protein D6D00_09987 [Aureobasidium pullulans]|nr:hypothetical protein D6D00_09987 [Aureobasidium pullulans]